GKSPPTSRCEFRHGAVPRQGQSVSLRPTTRRPSMLRALLCFSGIAIISAFAARADADDIQFNRDIRPILSETCFRCHGPDSAARKADLRFDRREVAVKIGAIVPGQPNKSEMITRIFSDDPDEQMPPPSSHKSLTAAQKDLLKCWIAAGAEYQP